MLYNLHWKREETVSFLCSFHCTIFVDACKLRTYTTVLVLSLTYRQPWHRRLLSDCWYLITAMLQQNDCWGKYSIIVWQSIGYCQSVDERDERWSSKYNQILRDVCDNPETLPIIYEASPKRWITSSCICSSDSVCQGMGGSYGSVILSSRNDDKRH